MSRNICDVLMFMFNQCNVNGLFNVGTGRAQSFRKLAEAVFHAMELEAEIEYIPMPESLQKKYQYYTQADMEKLRAVGYTQDFHDLDSGVRDYVQQYLEKDYAIY